MTANEYQEKAMKTALPGAKNIFYAIAALAEEAGECAGVLAKAMRDGGGASALFRDQERKAKLKKELGDVFWQGANAAEQMGWTLEEVLLENLDKLASRQQRGVLGGSGDNR